MSLNDNDLIFAKRLREARESVEIKQSELSEISGVSAATISAYESFDKTKGKKPSLANAMKLAQALNVSLDWLCGLSVNTEKIQYTDLLKTILEYEQINKDLYIDQVMPSDSVFKVLPAFAESYDLDVQPDEDVHNVAEYIEEITNTPSVAVTIKNHLIAKFLIDWKKIKQNYSEGIIDDELYNLWLSKKLQEIDEHQRKQEVSLKMNDHRIDELCNPAENNGGE